MQKRDIKRSIASFGLFEVFMMAITSSILSDAMINPSKNMSSLFCFFKFIFCSAKPLRDDAQQNAQSSASD
jgi:hypothetical protein